jgi:GNAT superfamily N-acetyltransferase
MLFEISEKLMSDRILIAKSDREISDCFPVIKELRSHLELTDFVAQVQRQQQFDYKLAYLQVDELVVAVAGFRISESLAWGKFLYVDDLVSKSVNRSQGYGTILFNWLVDYARDRNCQQLTLDSGVQRFAAHRFYLSHRMEITSHHFALKL